MAQGTGSTLIGVRWNVSGAEKEMDFFVKSSGTSVFRLETDAIKVGMPFQMTQTGTGYSFNLVSVTGTTASGNLRGWRVNVTTSASITHGDLQCIHGYLTLGATNTLATNAAVYPLSAWIDVPSDLTTGTGNLIAGLRVIFDANGLDLSSLAGGGESALIYAQKWSDSGGDLEHGLRIVCGGGTGSIKNAISVASTGSATLGRFLDWTEGPAGFQEFATLPLADAQSRHVIIYMGDSATNAAVFAEVSVTAGLGSQYWSSAGQMYIRVNNAGVEADWQVVDTSDN
jgi:hypothetical protein